MALECGVVVEVRAGKILVEAEPNDSCGSCSGKDSCHLLGKGKKRRLWMDNAPGAETGDVVNFLVEGRGIVYSSVLLYLLPVVFLVAGIVAGLSFGDLFGGDPELSAGVFGLGGLALAFVILRIMMRLVGERKVFRPVAVNIVDKKGRDW